MNRRAWTETEIEDLLATEVRQLALPDGRLQSVEASRLVWVNYDIVVDYCSLSPVELSALALFASVRKKQPFNEALSDALIPLRDEANRIMDEQAVLEERRRNLREKIRSDFNLASSSGFSAAQDAQDAPSSDAWPIIFKKILRD